ncbi:glutamine-synthetase adenylyltransferase [Sulfitobacter sp. S190]|uniref:[protein-PII] uridylyltransferase family protein n=1 Tax=Sulfitobacter sp. S190 TaxID=2867022 RepID=UPI0021A83BE3|nr:glutamine-synthetase adenylyltransferase [Sulfitobacter sp. S190]UWR20932.1 glutamine-synthetase adenylyltransferase [Sulfitobacter sp. S190]
MTEKPLCALLTRVPRVDPDALNTDLSAPFDASLRPLIDGATSRAPYLGALVTKEAEWLAGAVEAPRAALTAQIAQVAAGEGETLGADLRRAKRRVALLSALCDLGGAWTLEDVTGALTDLADAASHAALRAGVLAQIKRGKLPGLREEDAQTAGGTVVLAMGKMGARELNYSSDIDLICLFDEARFDVADFHEIRAGLIKAVRAMAATLSEITADGYVFRTDLRLRPDPAVTPVCLGVEAAERYYESLGRTWERAAYIKARACAGDIAVGTAFLETMRPFVWRRHLDFAAIQDAHDMRLAIREHKGLGGPITLPGHNMKLGRGGIREIEFFTQTRQLIAGGRDEDLRVRGTKEGLKVLAAKGWVDEAARHALSDHYTFHRTVEHRIQMVQDAQTHNLPKSPEGIARIAAMMDMDTAAFERELRERLSAVHEITEGFFADQKQAGATAEGHSFDEAVLSRWPGYPALRAPRAAELFEQLRPDLLARLAGAAKPNEALLAFDGFLAGLPAGVQLFSLLRANAHLADLLIDIVTVSPSLAGYLSRHAQVLDAVIGGDFFTDWPGQAGLQEMLAQRLTQIDDYETQLDATRSWAREWHFRIGVHHLRGLVDGATAGSQYSDLARAVLQALWPVVTAQFARRHGPPPGNGAVILGMGSLGAGKLTAQSDLDMIVIYDPDGVDMSDGRKPLATRQYYARLTQAMITALSAPMSQGRLYEVDLRLRPSGNKGPVATSIESFRNYQQTQAWVWEHLALTRAEVITGPDALADQVEEVRQSVLAQSETREKILVETAQMRDRIAVSKSPDGPLDAKIGPGRLQDIELFAQAALLISGQTRRDIPSGILAARDIALISEAQAGSLLAAYDQVWAVQAATRLLSPTPLQPDAVGEAAVRFLTSTIAGEVENDIHDGLEPRLTQSYDAAAAIIAAGLNAG